MNRRANSRAGDIHPTGKTSKKNPLDCLFVIDRLTVGPARIESRRICVPYEVSQGGTTETFELIFRYTADVFSPDDIADQNLAAMIGCQVALNYGLFAREIVFRGIFDQHDQRFIASMAENTAREIYVNKLLKPNSFLVGDATHLPVVKLSHYCQARLVFDAADGTAEKDLKARQSEWTYSANRFLVLSSGGKDSLLTFGLLREAKAEVHPVFVNESGRHWFTALNAYRYFDEHIPNTDRVWTNADRLFAWMLRKLPIVRQDFANVRSDAYPIRLWTVAVFVFGTLPIARKCGACQIIIGDEYDTTEKTTHEGITHYNGLYDQSRYFDDALCRYYARKRWGLTQFSILRPMSELLIEKTLAQRYPNLLALQTSCHATHKEGETIRPCGKCEKCRRIMTMLAAIDVDPKVCGYSQEQLVKSLAEFARAELHQELAGVQQLGHLLRSRGLIQADKIDGASVKERKEIMQLRFDRERSPIGAIPAKLRAKIYPLMLAHTEGAVEKQGRMWSAFDPLATNAMSQPYPFEQPERELKSANKKSANKKSAGNATDKWLWGEFTWPQAEAQLRSVDVALLPVGAIEQHGHHLPLDTDAFDADHLAQEVARACATPRPFVLPLIPYGVSYHHDDFRGTISVTNETLSRLVYEIGMSVARNGITKLVIINGHGGNAATLQFAAQMINRDAHIFTCVDTGETSDTDIDEHTETRSDLHAGEVETSTSLATRPHLVQMNKAKKCISKFSSRYLDFSSQRSVDWYARTAKISSSGVMGDPTKATVEKGHRIWEIMISNLVGLVEHLKQMTLDEIHQRNRF